MDIGPTEVNHHLKNKYNIAPSITNSLDIPHKDYVDTSVQNQLDSLGLTAIKTAQFECTTDLLSTATQ